MNYFQLYKESNRRLTDSLVSMWASGHIQEQECLRELLDEKEPLIAEPVFQTIFPWEPSKNTFREHSEKLKILDGDFVTALAEIDGDAKEFCFPADRYPYKHQSESWKGMLLDRKTIAVTSGTGSGKTECFIIPVLQDLYRQRCMPNYTEGVQAIFLYPLNALMKNQRERIHQWSKALPKPVTYAIYNGEMEESGKTTGEFPQVCTREEMRKHPPQILFTNPTMLNYMMVRSSDQDILEKSKGRLRWILLDEAHTYSGSAATELALQIRRVIDAFGVTLDDVNFAVTSATMGSGKEAEEKLKNIVSQLTGKNISDILIINGQRIIPELDKGKLQESINIINNKLGCELSIGSVNSLRKRLNDSPALSAKDIAEAARLKTDNLEKRLELIDQLSTEIPELGSNKNSLAILPTRIHFFVRAINGIYACINPECPHKMQKGLKLGNFTTYQSAQCIYCNSNMVEVASCADCGEFLVVGENNTKEGYRLRTNEASLDDNPFEIDSEELETDSEENMMPREKGWSMFVYGMPQKTNPRNIEPLYFEFDAQNHKIIPSSKKKLESPSAHVFQSVHDQDTGCDLCPYCGVPTGNKLMYLRASANLLGRNLASLILDNATPMDANDISKDKDILYSGKRYITFTDSRQGTAKSAMGINQDVERNWIRSAIYQKLAVSRQNRCIAQELNPSEQAEYNYYKQQENNLPPVLRNRFEELKQKMQGKGAPMAEPEAWADIRNALNANANLGHLYKHLKNAKFNTTTTSDGTSNERDVYLDALFLDQFGWIPKSSNTLENLGLVHIIYPALERARIPEELGAYKFKKDTPKFTDEDWRNYLKICVDYQIRGGKHYIVPSSSTNYLVQATYTKDLYDLTESTYDKGKKWPQLNQDGKLSIRLPKLALLLMAALGIKDVSELDGQKRTFINTLLLKAWRFIRDNLLEETDKDQKGYRLNLLDRTKVQLQIIEKGWRCPVDSVVVDTIFRGYSPRMRGYATQENFNRFRIDPKPMIFPYFPYAEGKKVSSDGTKERVTSEEIYKWINENWQAQKNAGLISNLHYQIMSPSSIYMAGEHSAQQQSSVLENYEKEFNQGHLNILSCSTTMEMGVDLKGISAVVMNSVPPKPANYQQRAGRAGRRGETKALALTFCTPNPVGIHAWNNPTWPLQHKTEIPDVKLSSPQIIQRHINAFLFEQFIHTIGGMGVKDTIGNFFAGSNGYEAFYNHLQNTISNGGLLSRLEEQHKKLIKGSCLSNQSIIESIHRCIKQIETIYSVYKDRFEALQASKKAAENGPAGVINAIKQRIDRFNNQFLLGYLAEQNFLPSAGIPTGLVEFDNTCNENNLNKKIPKKRIKLPTQHLSQAISMYAPGKQVVINEWCYQSSGIALKTKFDDAKRYIIQHCQKCNYTQIVYGSPLNTCPKCQSARMTGLKDISNDEKAKFTEIIEPAGFSVDWRGSVKPTRTIRNDNSMSFVQPLLLQMDPWPERNGIKVSMRVSTEESEILFYNSGSHKKGFMLCPYCGRMESETDENARNRFIDHKHLETGSACEGSGHDGARIRHNVLLVGRYQTDFVELKFYDGADKEIENPETLYSLGVIISRKLAEYLGINDGEIDFGYNGRYHSIFIYDTALGGAGYSPLLRDYKNEVFDLARKALKNDDCNKACTKCLVDRSSQWYLNYLDRKKALDWLEMEYSTRTAPAEIRDVFPDAEAITSDWSTEFYRICRDNSIKSMKFFIDSDIEKWDFDSFLFKQQIDQLKARIVDCSYVTAKKINFKSIDLFDITQLFGLLYSNKFEYGELNLNNIKPLLGVTYNDGRKKLFFGENVSNALDGSWGNGVVFSSIFDSDFIFKPVDMQSILTKFTNSNEGMFDFEIKDASASAKTMFDIMQSYKAEKWIKLDKVFGKGGHVSISYADKFLNTPLGCIILANIVNSIVEKWHLQIDSLSLSLTVIRGSNVYGNNDFDSDFVDATCRNNFLKTCFNKIVGIEPKIEMFNNLHPRFLKIKSESCECVIRPDAGVAWGWVLDRLHSKLKLNEFGDNPTQDLKLFNKRQKDGILYTVAWRKNE